MRLVHLSIASIAGCLLGLVILIGLTLDSVHEVRAKQAEVAELLNLQARMDDFSVASDSLLLFGADAGLLAAYREESQALQRRLREVGGDSPGARRAIHRLEQIVITVSRETERRMEAATGDGPLEMPPRSRIVMNQVAGLGGEMDSALDTLLRQRQQQIARDAAWIGGGLAGAALLFGALSVIAFILIHRRVASPARELATTLDAIRAGDLHVRAPVRGDDELAQVAETLNRMLDERQAIDGELNERNRRLQQYQRLVEHSSDRFCIVDSNFRYTLANEAYAALYGMDRATLEGAHLRDVLDAGFLETEAVPPIERCLAGEPQRFEAERTYDSIGTRRFLIRYYPLPDAEGNIREVAAVMTDITEQSRLDERVRQFHELIEGTEDLCGIADADYRYLWVNQAYLDMHGLQREEMEGRTLPEVLGPDYFEESVKSRVDRCLAGEIQRFETEREFSGMGRRRLLARYYPIESPDGRRRRVGAVITDVTEIREAEAEMAAQARLLDMAGRAAHLGGWSVDLGSDTIEWSAVTAEIHGMPPGYSPSLDEGLAFYAPEDRDRIRDLFTACAEHGRSYDEELQIIDAEGRRVWVRVVGEAVRDEAGRIARVQGALQDISASRRQQARLARYRALIEHSTDLVCLIDERYRYALVNASYAHLSGCEPADIEGRSVREFLGDRLFEDEVSAQLEQAFAGESVECEQQRPSGDHDYRYILVRYQPIENDQGRIDHVGVTITDITERKRFEAELEASLETRRTLINSLPAHIALLDADGAIIDVNDQWRHFGQENDYRGGDDFGVGTNYIALCEGASGECAEEAGTVADGLREVLAARRGTFALEYPCHSPDKQRWFRVMFNRLSTGESAAGGAVAMHIDITERKLAEQELNRLAFEDLLTGLLSRNGFSQRLAQRFESHGWQPGAIVAMVDVVNLRDINDAHGYASGDQLLAELGRRLTEQAGEHGLAGRTGGDEFVLYLDASSYPDIEPRLRALSTALERPYPVDSGSVEITLRIGYSVLGENERPAESLMREAELSLFENRKQDSAQLPWIAYSETLDQQTHERIRLTRELRDALEAEEFELHYQPKVNLQDGSLISAEALLRWNHPERGLQPPGLFIPVAEQSQLIGPIGDWALRAACRQLREWRDDGLEIVRIAVNVSLVQFTLGGFPAKVRAALEEFGVDPQHLSLEITESVFERVSDQLLTEIRELHELGVRLSLDDFGTGYSSLLYLQRYPFDEIKIDQGFVFRLLEDHYSLDIVRTVMGLAHALDAEAVAEGIESAEIRDALLELGCTVGQGYYYSVPLAAEDFRWLLEMRSNLPLQASADG